MNFKTKLRIGFLVIAAIVFSGVEITLLINFIVLSNEYKLTALPPLYEGLQVINYMAVIFALVMLVLLMSLMSLLDSIMLPKGASFRKKSIMLSWLITTVNIILSLVSISKLQDYMMYTAGYVIMIASAALTIGALYLQKRLVASSAYADAATEDSEEVDTSSSASQ